MYHMYYYMTIMYYLNLHSLKVKFRLVIFLGSVEIMIGLLILGRFIHPILSAIGGLLSIALFTVTLGMMIFLPGITTEAGFPTLSFVGEFLLKDIGLFAASVFITGNSLAALSSRFGSSQES